MGDGLIAMYGEITVDVRLLSHYRVAIVVVNEICNSSESNEWYNRDSEIRATYLHTVQHYLLTANAKLNITQ